MRIERVLAEHGGTARWKDLDDAGVTHVAIARALAEGRVTRPHRGCYALPESTRARTLATIFRGMPTCVTWCASAGLPLERPSRIIHLGLPNSRGLGEPRLRPESEVLLHRCGRVGDDFPLHHLDVASACTSPLQQVALLDAALAKGLIDPREILALVRGSAARRSWIARHVTGSAQSLGETYARVVLRELGLTVEPQARVGGVGAVDLLVEGRLIVEIDGFVHHSDPHAFGVDRRRDRTAVLRGHTVLRFTHAEVVADPMAMGLEVVDAWWRLGGPRAKLRTAEAAARRLGNAPWWR